MFEKLTPKSEPAKTQNCFWFQLEGISEKTFSTKVVAIYYPIKYTEKNLKVKYVRRNFKKNLKNIVYFLGEIKSLRIQ